MCGAQYFNAWFRIIIIVQFSTPECAMNNNTINTFVTQNACNLGYRGQLFNRVDPFLLQVVPSLMQILSHIILEAKINNAVLFSSSGLPSSQLESATSHSLLHQIIWSSGKQHLCTGAEELSDWYAWLLLDTPWFPPCTQWSMGKPGYISWCD